MARRGRLVRISSVGVRLQTQTGKFGGHYSDYVGAIHPDDRDAVATTISDVLESDQGELLVAHRVRWPDGTIRAVEARETTPPVPTS